MNQEKYTLQEVTTPAVEREWLNLPKRIYKGNRNWVCPLDQDVLEVFDPARNELFADGEAIRWVVRDASGEVVGRIAAFYNREKAAIEEQPTGGCQLRRMFALQGVELVERVEVHDLDARCGIDLLAGEHFGEVGFGDSVGVGVAVGVGEPQEAAVLSDEGEVYTPGVDADRRDSDPFAGSGAEAFAQVFVEREDVPVVVAAEAEHGVREAGQLLEGELPVAERAEDRPAAGGPEVEGDEVFGLHVSACGFVFTKERFFLLFRRGNMTDELNFLIFVPFRDCGSLAFHYICR